ncbi:MAG: hypothetical protein PHE25_04810 [Candidatus Gracilibacteria bacterium]|nr:hypothetical protein [Candidatus Gracilibacteria bacterium]
MLELIFNELKQKIKSSDIIQPILFLGENLELLNSQIDNLIKKLFIEFEVDKNCLYKLVDNKEKVKISQIREFSSKSLVKSNFKFQIFFIENISRLNIESFNSCLKFLEEPGKGNIIFLTNNTESSIPETILSRVKIINLFLKKDFLRNDFFYNLIDNFVSKKDTNLFKYFFDDKKISKEDYINFLYNFTYYIKEKLICIDLLEQIEESLNLIQKNNVLPKYEIDKLLLKL